MSNLQSEPESRNHHRSLHRVREASQVHAIASKVSQCAGALEAIDDDLDGPFYPLRKELVRIHDELSGAASVWGGAAQAFRVDRLREAVAELGLRIDEAEASGAPWEELVALAAGAAAITKARLNIARKRLALRRGNASR
jgi:hypothetical protein